MDDAEAYFLYTAQLWKAAMQLE